MLDVCGHSCVNRISGIRTQDHKANILQSQPSFLQLLDEYEFIIAPLIFTAFAFFTRLYRIGLSPIVTWDEAQ
jgi:dolichyl-phosphate-mannose-protein mannosyltransferase